MKATLVFPNQLFESHPAISRSRKSFVVQDPLFFNDLSYGIKFHKQKILLHLMSTQTFNSELNRKGIDSTLVTFDQLDGRDYLLNFLKDNLISEIYLCHVVDFELNKRILTSAKECRIKVHWYDSPGFLSSESQITSDFIPGKRFFMANYYKKQRRRFNILINENGQPQGGKWSFDPENRKKLPKTIVVPAVKKLSYSDKKFNKGKMIIEHKFSQNPGEINHFNYPVSRSQALNAFETFLVERLELFGDYEDALSVDHNVTFHSLLTPYLNIGLITPLEIVNRILDFSKSSNVRLNSLEGFIRQIIGWREFIRGIYHSSGVSQRTKNFWGYKKKLPDAFYTGETGIEPVDSTIKKINKYAYCHHIERLMILGNIMILLKYDPDEVYKWFMELFIDSYDWVMVPNVYGMSQYADGGIMSTKPYISGSNYILKMSNYKKGQWSQKWDALYWNFINENRSFFQRNPRMSMMVSMYDKKDSKQKTIYKQLIDSLNL